MAKVITKEIQQALRNFLQARGISASAFASEKGWAASTTTDWLNGKTRSIRPAHWQAIEPLIEPFLKATPIPQSDGKILSDFSDWQAVPLAGGAAAHSNGAVTVPTVGDAHEAARAYFPRTRPGDIAIRVEGDSMCPWYPPGTVLLVSTTEWPVTGDRVVVVTEEEDVLFKVFLDRGDSIELLSINREAGQDYTVAKRQAPRIYPIRMSLRDEHDLDTQMDAAGIQHFWARGTDRETDA
jgi:phage repressor protein C with HTH and peptisase S24 domain